MDGKRMEQASCFCNRVLAAVDQRRLTDRIAGILHMLDVFF